MTSATLGRVLEYPRHYVAGVLFGPQHQALIAAFASQRTSTLSDRHCERRAGAMKVYHDVTSGACMQSWTRFKPKLTFNFVKDASGLAGLPGRYADAIPSTLLSSTRCHSR